MANEIEKCSPATKALSPERQRMNDALERLGRLYNRKTRRQLQRLIFALDLTGSREHTLTQARIATATMFDTIKMLGGIAVKLLYYRGSNECSASHWHTDLDFLSQSMQRLSCESGYTQIAPVLRLVLGESEPVSGVVFVGDHCEEDDGELRELAAALGQRSIPLFLFHECADDDQRSLDAKPLFKRMAAASGGVYCEFKPDNGAVLREMLLNVTAFSAAGVRGLKQITTPGTPEARKLQLHLLLGSGTDD